MLLMLGVGSCRKLGTWLVKSDAPEHADAMVLLMGSFSERVLQTADLYQAQVSGKVWIVEEGMGAYRILEEKGVQVITNSTQARNALVTLGIPADSIMILPPPASKPKLAGIICPQGPASIPSCWLPPPSTAEGQSKSSKRPSNSWIHPWKCYAAQAAIPISIMCTGGEAGKISRR